MLGRLPLWPRLGRLAESEGDWIQLYDLMAIRWIAIIGQLVTILVVHTGFDFVLPVWPLITLLLMSIFLNIALGVTFKAEARLPGRFAAPMFAFDILQLSGLLLLTGGIQNPFCVLILVPVALAAATLGARGVGVISALSIGSLTVLATWPEGVPWSDGPLQFPVLFRFASWLGMCIGTLLVAVFVWSLAAEARRRVQALHLTQIELAREQQNSALGGQAAAMVHLLGSPLGTINIIAKELVRELPADGPLSEDARDLLTEIRRCRDLLNSLGRKDNAVAVGEDSLASLPLTAQLKALVQSVTRSDIDVEVRLDLQPDTEEPRALITPETRHALSNLLQNALHHARGQVIITVRPRKDALLIMIEDDGAGFAPDVLDWLGEPFLSTRRKEGGMGLGIFIAKTLLARSGATAQFENSRSGSCVRVSWPASVCGRDLVVKL